MSVKQYLRIALVLGLLLASQTAAALGLGQIRLKSQVGEPLLAEIPIISNDPRELQQLRAGLASPETFARIGLRPPEGIVARLQFTSALDDRGNPVIRVTSVEPIQDPLLTFLVEVDWGQGRLVREYSALLDAPRTVSAPMQPPIDAPVAAPSNTIVRTPEPAPAAEEATAPAEQAPTDPEPADPQESAPPVPAPVAAPPPAVPAPSVPAPRPDQYGTVQSGETLSQIAEQLDLGVSLEQAMIALLRANPAAFIDGNINLLKQGVVLRVPPEAEVRGVEAAQAMAQVREQTRAWRAAREAVAQPEQAASADGGEAAADASEAEAEVAGAEAAGEAATTSDARLEIVPPGASEAAGAGEQSGISAGGEGDMVRQELLQTRESLAAREAELAELGSRLDELEQLQSDQQQLLTMKDSELAAMQSQLAEARQQADAAGADPLPWLLGGALLLVLAVVGGWWFGRRAPATPDFRATPPTARTGATSAAGFPSRNAEPAETTAAQAAAEPSVPAAATAPAAAKPVDEAGAAPAAPAPETAVPAWHLTSAAAMPPAAATAPAGAAPTPPSAEGSATSERLELAQAYLDMGDRDSARQLLSELVVVGDLDARQKAARMLRDIE